jgi:hypothetical protein
MMVKDISQFKPTQELDIQLKKETLFHCEKRFGSVESIALFKHSDSFKSTFQKDLF